MAATARRRAIDGMPPRWADGCVSASPGSRMQDRIATLHTRNVKQDEEREKRRESPQRCACVRRRGEKDVGMFTATRCGAVLCLAGLGPPFVGSRRCGRRRRRGLNGSGLRCGGLLLGGQRCKTSCKAAKPQSYKGGSVDSIGRRTEQRSPEAPFRWVARWVSDERVVSSCLAAAGLIK